jgi:hypothetical protein
MSSNSGVNKQAVVRGIELQLDTAYDGVQNFWPAGLSQLVVEGVNYTQSSLAAKLTSTVSPWKGARDAHATLRQFTQEKPQITSDAKTFLSSMDASLGAVVGQSNELLTKFGFTPKKRRKALTVEEQTLKTAKAKLTRQKRGTLGSRQKAAIKESGAPTVTITPGASMEITQASSPSASVPPAPPPPVGKSV